MEVTLSSRTTTTLRMMRKISTKILPATVSASKITWCSLARRRLRGTLPLAYCALKNRDIPFSLEQVAGGAGQLVERRDLRVVEGAVEKKHFVDGAAVALPQADGEVGDVPR